MNLKDICYDIEKSNKTDHVEILRIIKSNSSINITENNNGCFVNMKDIPERVLQDIKLYLNYIKNKNLELDKQELIKKNMKESLITII
mgnify:CR=1 FL=1|tara:strand:- start:42 stop:305 length:264 start_codon:yes stop_codon:yes gene_type:complete